MSGRRIGIGFALVLVAVLLLSLSAASADAESLLGVPLPASASDVKIALNRDLLGVVAGDFEGYVRFELSPQDAHALLSSPEFQRVQTTTQPQGIMGNSVGGSVPVAERALQQPPLWWKLDAGKDYLVGYRSFQPAPLAQTGVDFAWYMIDMSDPARAVAYVYLMEV